MRNSTKFLLLVVVQMVAVSPATAFLGCADSVAGIEFGLTVAVDNGQDDEIRVVAGTYDLTQGLSYLSDEPYSLTISGDWNGDCSVQGAGATTLDAHGVDQVLRIFTHAVSDISVTRLTFVNGRLPLSGSGYASGLSIRSAGDVLVEADEFFLNQSNDDTSGGGLQIEVEDSGTMRVRNNLLVLNSAGYNGAGVLVATIGEHYVIGNTIVANQATHASSDPTTGGLLLGDGVSAHFVLSNNILWMNTGNDLYNRNDSTLLIHNDIGVFDGVAAEPASNGNISTDPVFGTGLFNFRPASRSPLINAGSDTPPGGAGLFDLGGSLRRQSSHIDIGAYESDVIYFGGFEP